MERNRLRFCLAIFLLTMSACSRGPTRLPTYAVQGSILHQGKPATGAIVIFHPAQTPPSGFATPRGKAGPDGRFELTTYDTGDGAPQGNYRVTVYWPRPPAPGQPNNDDGPDLLMGKYLRPENPLTHFTVQPEENQMEPLKLK